MPSGTEAPCKHVVELAQAHCRANTGSRGMRELALVNPDNAEAGCHRVFQNHNLVPPVAIERVDLAAGPKKISNHST